MITVVLDKREKKSRRDMIRDRFSTFKEVSVSEDMIPVGDYLVKKDDGILFAVEWKTYTDFVSSIMNNHLQSQLEDMDSYEHPYLFVTGNYKQWISKTRSLDIHITKEQIMGFVTSVAGRHKTKLIMFDSEGEGLDGLIKLIAIHMNENPIEMKLPERHKRIGNPNIDMLMAIPGIGPKKVQEMDKVGITLLQLIIECKNQDKVCINGVKISKNVVDYLKKV